MARSPRPRRHGRVRETAAPRYPAPASGIAGVLLDSDIIIEVLRGRAATVTALRGLERSGVPTYCCAVQWAEIHAGVRPGEEPLTSAFFESRQEVPLDGRIGHRAGAYLARHARSHGVELADALVAAAAAVTGLYLWTLNRKHYPMPDLRFYES